MRTPCLPKKIKLLLLRGECVLEGKGKLVAEPYLYWVKKMDMVSELRMRAWCHRREVIGW